MKYVIHREGVEKDLGKVTLTAVETGELGEVREITPERSLKVRNHSPTGFEFGYGGSGPAQLALAILLDLTDDPALAQAHHQNFKWEFIGPMQHPGGEIESDAIKEWLKEQ